MRHDPLFKKKGSNVWWCRVPNPQGGRHLRFSTGQYDRAAALAEWRRLCREPLEGPHTPKNSPALADALDRRAEERRQAGRAQGTLDMYRKKSRHLTRLLGAETPLHRIAAIEVDEYIAQRTKEGAKPATIHKELTVLSGTLKLARRRKEYPYPLDEVLPLDFSPRYVPRERALSVREVELVLKALPPKRAAVVAFICATGATYPSEVAPMREGDAERSTVRLRGTKRETRHRFVPIPDFARSWFAFAKKHLPFDRWTNIRRDLLAVAEKLGIEPFCPTDLRRTFGHLLRAQGREPHLIGAMLGHRDSRMAEKVYAKLRPKDLAALLRGPAGGQKRRQPAKPAEKRAKHVA